MNRVRRFFFITREIGFALVGARALGAMSAGRETDKGQAICLTGYHRDDFGLGRAFPALPHRVKATKLRDALIKYGFAEICFRLRAAV